MAMSEEHRTVTFRERQNSNEDIESYFKKKDKNCLAFQECRFFHTRRDVLDQMVRNVLSVCVCNVRVCVFVCVCVCNKLPWKRDLYVEYSRIITIVRYCE